MERMRGWSIKVLFHFVVTKRYLRVLPEDAASTSTMRKAILSETFSISDKFVESLTKK